MPGYGTGIAQTAGGVGTTGSLSPDTSGPSTPRRKRRRMPAVSEKQRRFMGAELSRKRAGKKTKTGMSTKQLRDFATKREMVKRA